MPESSYKSASWFEFSVNILGFEYATKFYKLYHAFYYNLINKSQFSTIFNNNFLPFIKILFQGCKF